MLISGWTPAADFVDYKRYRHPFLIHLSQPEAGVFQWNKHALRTKHGSGITDEMTTNPDYTFDCTNITDIEITNSSNDSRIWKGGRLGIYNGRELVVRSVSGSSHVDQKCIDAIKVMSLNNSHINKCLSYITVQIMKEVTVQHNVKHRNLVRIIGLCRGNKSRSQDALNKQSVIVVNEIGTDVTENYLKGLPYYERLKHALELAELLVYFKHTPLGSLKMPDFSLRRFVLIDNHLKMKDIYMISNGSKFCNSKRRNQCDLNTECNISLHQCVGYNTAYNVRQFANTFRNLFFVKSKYPEILRSKIGNLAYRLANSAISAEYLFDTLQTLLDIHGDLLVN